MKRKYLVHFEVILLNKLQAFLLSQWNIFFLIVLIGSCHADPVLVDFAPSPLIFICWLEEENKLPVSAAPKHFPTLGKPVIVMN